MIRSKLMLLGVALISLTLSGCFESWKDPDTGLMWQIKSKDADSTEFRGIIPIEAFEYCENLVSAGYDNWRMPTYAELQSIIADNPNTEPGGACQVGDAGAGTAQGKTAVCASTAPAGDYGGPGAGGCYWKEGLQGPCNRVDPYGTHPYETLAADPAHDQPNDWISYVTFATGAVGYNHACSLAEVRCVRSDKPVEPCLMDGKPCHEYYRSKAYCDQDFTAQADILRVTINLPSTPSIDPAYQLVGFLYKTDPEWYPPLGPPDGGTDYNQIFLAQPGSPVIDVGTPYVMEIPGTSYYREALLDGDYQLFFELQLVNIFPPIPVAGDFIYGENQLPISFPFNGSEHTGTVLEMEVNLELVGCPSETPVACADRSCAIDADSCPVANGCPETSSCFPNCPSDVEIYTCFYNNIFDGGNIAMVDYPSSENWTSADALTNCQSILGSSNERIVNGNSQSALVQIGGQASGRCVFTDDGKRSFAQDLSSTICALGGGVREATGPYCNVY
ncbi:MAG: hypothetical protein COA99_00465 [Moraxellaceae bacterium]|nr:MAG: hypothetical protein COA99_00465 [Moraxellaceae bacterium]